MFFIRYFLFIPKKIQKLIFRLEPKLFRINDHNPININAIWIRLRSLILEALTKPKSQLLSFLGYTVFLLAGPVTLLASPVAVDLTQENTHQIAIQLSIEEGWHVYGQNPGDIGSPLQIEWELPSGVELGPIQWPSPETFTLADMTGYGYTNKVTLKASYRSSNHTPSELKAHVTYLACNEFSCQPGEQTLSLSLEKNDEIADSFEEPLSHAPSVISHSSESSLGALISVLFFAFLGGMLLNLMPCVLPVISLKMMNFVSMSGENRSIIWRHGLVFSLGVLLSFWILASFMLLLRIWGHSVGWGFQLQEPLFVLVLATFIFIFALNLLGVFEWGLTLSSWAGQTLVDRTHNHITSYSSSFCSGILATVVATPCTGPFLGSAVGFAVTVSSFQAMLIFTCIACGMCFPYLLLAAHPSALRFLPKPGLWMETFRQLMGFLLLATVLWLLWIFSAQTPHSALISVLFGFLFFSIAAWIYGRGSYAVSKKTRLFSITVSLLFIALGGKAVFFTDNTSPLTSDSWDGWEDFSPQRLEELRRKSIPVFVDFTARWCLICQANHLTLSSHEVTQQIEQAGIVKMKADWTLNDPIITAELAKFGRSSVPLYVLYGTESSEEPKILPQILSPDIIASHVGPIARKN